MWHLILAWVEKGEVSQDNKVPKPASHHFVGYFYQIFNTDLGTRLLWQEKITNWKVSSLVSWIGKKLLEKFNEKPT